MSEFKSNIVFIALLLTATLFIMGGYFALDRLIPSFFYPESVVLAEDIIITPEQTEIIGNNLLKVNKEKQFVALVLDSNYTDSHSAVRNAEGEFITIEIKLIDEEGNEFPLHLESFRSPSINGDLVPEFGYLKGYNTLPIGKVFKKVVLRSNKTLKVKSVLWSGYNIEDRK